MTTTGTQSWLDGFKQRAKEKRVPISGMLELTSRCNLRCVHCYLGDQDAQHRRREEEMDTSRIFALIDELAEAGCLFLTITGGDPMMRRDFSEIYTHARKRGMIVTVFCDGILVNDRIIDLFKTYPPRLVEISLYGATEETYESVTRVKGSYSKALKGIQRLKDEGVRVGLKTVLLSLNVHEYNDMKAMADNWGMGWRFDGAVFPCLHTGDRTPTDYRVAPEEVVKLEFNDEMTRTAWMKNYDYHKQGIKADKRLFTCGAGQSTFYIDPFGQVSPCLLTSYRQKPLEGSSFTERWNSDLAEIRTLTQDENEAELNNHHACSTCPAFNHLDTGSETSCSPYQKALTKERERAIVNLLNSKAQKKP
jgi:radical SAM protein with 4Fe4S-binding SPASM domain